VRLGLFLDAAYRSDGKRVWSGNELLGFSTFAAAVGRDFERMLVVSRATEDPEQAPFELPEGLEHYALPYYPSLRRLPSVIAAIPATVRALWRSLDEVDMVWVSAANPVALLFAGLARLRRRRIAVLVRQETMVYYRNRLPGRAWTPLLAPLWLVERLFKRLGRRHPVTAVGAEIARAYGAPRANVIEFEVNLIPGSEIRAEPREGGWERPVRLLTVGRIEPEKDPALLVETLAGLERADPGRFTVTWAGDGKLRDELEAEARRAGLGATVRLPGFVPFGPRLRALYDEADAYVHVAKTEGVPGVICEAMALGLPIVATDVGGIRAATGDGAAAILVAPGDAEGLAAAIGRLAAEPDLRRRLAAAGLALARRSALDVESRRVAEFLKAGS
jgi:glycosyltransferase involved in cell wall biosynthesis